MKLCSIIIPTLNEAARIESCLVSLGELLNDDAVQVIISDGGSEDDTLAIAARFDVEIVHADRGRARQMNAGALQANAGLLVFLHADTHSNTSVNRQLRDVSAEAQTIWGRFDVQLSGPGLIFRVIERCMNTRSRLTGIATGDQLIFCSASLFHRVKGYADIALMEDIELSRRLGRVVAPVCCREKVTTSSRKWREHGVLRTIILMWRLRLSYFLGVDPNVLAKQYYA